MEKPKLPIDQETLAQSVTRISDSVRKLMDSGLNEKAIVALIYDDTKISKNEIKGVLASLKDLAKKYAVEKR